MARAQVRCRLSRRQRRLYDEYMTSGETRSTLAGGNFMGIISCLMQLRKVDLGGYSCHVLGVLLLHLSGRLVDACTARDYGGSARAAVAHVQAPDAGCVTPGARRCATTRTCSRAAPSCRPSTCGA